ncbi:MAG TPA: winged helix-turn-helix domain-containing protein [Candidatus Rubrimentiphilum sp.]|nr:winged helix-turn-helix domain-containing protein [Candidatus Rubrimentiphilum sp.]
MTSRLEFDRYVLDERRRQLLRDGKALPLSAKTFELLLLFAASEGGVLTREGIFERLWPASETEDANLSQHIYLLRRILDPDGDGRDFIETVPRIGYRFAKEVRPVREPAVAAWDAAWKRAAFFAGAVLLLALILPAVPREERLPVGAREAYTLGIYHLNLRTEDNLNYALAYFKQTARLAPKNAIGYASVASAYALLAQFKPEGSRAQRSLVALAKAYRDEALKRDPRSSQGLAASGLIAYRFGNDRAAAERDLRASLAADGANAQAHHWLGEVLLSDGRTRDAITELQTAHRLDPTSEVYARWLARAYTYARQPDEAVPLAIEALRLQPNDASAWLVLACAQEQRGKLRDAIQTLKTLAARLPSERPYALADRSRLEFLIEGRAHRTEAIAGMDRLVALNRADPFEAALFYLTAGERKSAKKMLAQLKPFRWLAELDRYDPRFRSLGNELVS